MTYKFCVVLVFAILAFFIVLDSRDERRMRVREVEALEEIAFYMDKWDSTGIPQ